MVNSQWSIVNSLVFIRPPDIHNGHGAGECAGDGHRYGAVYIRELHVVGIDAASLQGEINQYGEGVV